MKLRVVLSIGIEIDNDLVGYLKQRFAGYDKFLLEQNNFLHFDLNSLFEKTNQWKAVGNLPYNVATPMIFLLLSRTDIFSKLILMTQLEVAERIVAKPNTKAYGRLSILLQRRAAVALQYRIESSCFYPKPKVQSAIIELIPKAFDGHSPIEIQIEKITREAFNRRRKTIANSLNAFFSKEEILLCELDPSYRAEALSIKDYEKLARYRLEKKCFG